MSGADYLATVESLAVCWRCSCLPGGGRDPGGGQRSRSGGMRFEKGHKAEVLSQRRGAIDIEAMKGVLDGDGRGSLVCDRRRRRQDSLGIAAAGATRGNPTAR